MDLEVFSLADLIQACMNFTGPQEGDVKWPYRDSAPAGNITVGRGHLIATIPLLADVFDVGPLTAEEAWTDLMACEPGHPAAFYETATALRLTQEQDDALFRTDIEQHVANCQRLIAGFNGLPQPIQVACNDIDFNVKGGIRTFPGLIRCVEAGDWSGAARESNRPQLPARSEATRALILSAVQPASVS